MLACFISSPPSVAATDAVMEGLFTYDELVQQEEPEDSGVGPGAGGSAAASGGEGGEKQGESESKDSSAAAPASSSAAPSSSFFPVNLTLGWESSYLHLMIPLLATAATLARSRPHHISDDGCWRCAFWIALQLTIYVHTARSEGNEEYKSVTQRMIVANTEMRQLGTEDECRTWFDRDANEFVFV